MPRDKTDDHGTRAIVAATLFAALAVLGFQVIASRSLGIDEFAPVALTWTVMFLLYTVFLLPAEQHLTRALVVTRTASQITKVRREMMLSFSLALIVGVSFTVITLERFYAGSLGYVLVMALIVINRSLMVLGRGFLAGHRRFVAYGASIAIEGAALLLGGAIVALLSGDALAYTVVVAVAPLATMVIMLFHRGGDAQYHHVTNAQSGHFLIWLVVATGASQVIIAGGPIAVSFVGGGAAAVSIYFSSFALLRGPVTSAYNLVARILPNFTDLALSEDPNRLWNWARRILLGGALAALLGALGSGLLLRTIVGIVYGSEFAPPALAASLGGAGVGLGLAALVVTQVYSAADAGARLAFGWAVGLLAALSVLFWIDLDPVSHASLAFVVGEGTGLVMLGFVLVKRRIPTAESSR